MDLVTALLPFLILIVFWIFLMRYAQRRGPADPLAEKLDAVHQELVRIRRLLEEREAR